MFSYAGSLPSAAPGAELRHPGEAAHPDPDRREQDVEDEVPQQQGDPPERPAPEGDARLRGHRAACALASPARSSTTRRMRCAVSSIDSSEMSMTGQRSLRWSFFAC